MSDAGEAAGDDGSTPADPAAAPDAGDEQQIPPGLLVSVDSRGGYAVPRQLDGHRGRGTR